MKKSIICAAVAVSLVVGAGYPKRSDATGIPTVDIVANLLWVAEMAANVVRWADQIKNAIATVQNTLALVDATVSDFSFHDLMGNTELVELLPAGALDFYNQSIENGYGSYFDKLVANYDADFIRDSCTEALEAAKSVCEEIAMASYKDEVITDTSAERIATLGAEIDALYVDLGAATTIKEVADLQVLMTGLQTKIQTEKLALETVRRKGADQLGVLHQRQEQIASQVYDLPDFELQPIDFGNGNAEVID